MSPAGKKSELTKLASLTAALALTPRPALQLFGAPLFHFLSSPKASDLVGPFRGVQEQKKVTHEEHGHDGGSPQVNPPAGHGWPFPG